MDASTRRPRRLAAKLLVLALGVLVGVGVLEVGVRLMGVVPQSVRIAGLGGEVPSGENVEGEGLPDQSLYVRTPTGVRLKRSTRAVVRNHNLSKRDVEITTNALGFRHPELGPKERGERRVLVLGDSITFGDYVDAEQTYPAHLERALRMGDAGGSSTLQVINAGVGAIDLQNMLAILMETGLSAEPDFILVGLYLNDAYHSPYLEVSRLPAPLGRSALASHLANQLDLLRARQLVRGSPRAAMQHFQQARAELAAAHPGGPGDYRTDPRAFDRIVLEAFTDWGYAWSPRYWQKIESLLAIIEQVATERGIGLAVALLPVKQQVEAGHVHDAPQRQFAALMERMSIPHLDVLPVLRALPKGEVDALFYDHCHYTPGGNRIVGEAMAELVGPLLSPR